MGRWGPLLLLLGAVTVSSQAEEPDGLPAPLPSVPPLFILLLGLPRKQQGEEAGQTKELCQEQRKSWDLPFLGPK